MFLLILLFLLMSLFFYCYRKNSVLARILAISGSLLILPVCLFAYELLSVPPEDPAEFISWAFAVITSFKGASASVIVGGSITILLWIFNYFKTKTFMDRLGNWKFIIPIGLGAIAELCFNFPETFTWSALLAVLSKGATMNGAIAIALHHTCKRIKDIIK
jgi:hypothetical protein